MVVAVVEWVRMSHRPQSGTSGAQTLAEARATVPPLVVSCPQPKAAVTEVTRAKVSDVNPLFVAPRGGAGVGRAKSHILSDDGVAKGYAAPGPALGTKPEGTRSQGRLPHTAPITGVVRAKGACRGRKDGPLLTTPRGRHALVMVAARVRRGPLGAAVLVSPLGRGAAKDVVAGMRGTKGRPLIRCLFGLASLQGTNAWRRTTRSGRRCGCGGLFRKKNVADGKGASLIVHSVKKKEEKINHIGFVFYQSVCIRKRSIGSKPGVSL